VREDAAGDDLTAALLGVLDQLSGHAADPGPASSTARIDRIAVLEQIRSSLAAAQYSEMVAFGRQQVEEQVTEVEAGRLDPVALGRGIADQIALACRISPFHGSRRLGIARALHSDLPGVGALLAAGQISERVAEIVVTQTAHLDAEGRRLVDKHLAAAGLENLSSRRAEAAIKRCSYEVDRAGYVARGRTARTDRRVTLRPAPDTMSVLSGFLPVEQGVACLAALRAHADTVLAGGDTRTRDQVMADTLIERLTGQATAADVNVEIGIVLPLDALLDPEAGGSAEITGYGSVPAGIARDVLAGSAGTLWWRRLFTAPDTGSLVGGDPRRRRFDGALAHLIKTRDQGWCRDPFCDAPIRHLDHIDRHSNGGPTTLANGRGVCARGNYVREMPGWHIELIDDGLGPAPHTVRTTTPTGHTYLGSAGPAP
jgi:hypothetical protein